MDDKKKWLHRSQIIGIIWISASLAIIATVGFFSSRHSDSESKKDPVTTTNVEKLAAKEDSAYKSRRKAYKTSRISSKKTYDSYVTDTTMYSKRMPATRRQPLVVELNSADTTTLQLLHGIGPAYAGRIVRYREKLGGFTNMSQLLEVYGFTPALLEHIRPSLVLDTTTLRRMNINTIELKQLIKHPYIEYYQARDIINLRNKGVTFGCADDLRAVPSMADSTLERLMPYLEFGGE